MKTPMRALCAGLAIFLSAGVTAAESTGSGARAPMSLGDILSASPRSPETSAIPQIRYNAIRETALTYGAQAGLARRNFENKEKLERRAQDLDVIYNFQALMLEGNVLPPVLSETSDIYDQSSDDMLRVIGKVFRIEQQARFVYTTPNWRSYMLTAYEFDQNLTLAVAPQNDSERAVWKASVEEGFKIGVEQADKILEQNFAVLRRDFLGMVLYHRMLDNGMVTRPYVAANKSGVVRSKDGSMHIGEVFLRITASPDFVDSADKWKTGPKSLVQERLQRYLDPDAAREMRNDAVNSGRVREIGR